MLSSDSVDVLAQIQGEIGQVELAVHTAEGLDFRVGFLAQHFLGELGGKTIVSRRHRSVGGEDAFLAHRLDLGVRDLRATRGPKPFAEQLDGE